MSQAQLKAFLEKVQSDSELQDKLNGAADADAVAEIVKEAGFSITSEDISMYNLLTVSDEELEGAAGGAPLQNCCPAWARQQTASVSFN